MNVITGGPAFPFTEFQKDGAKVSAYGMTLRDYLAAKAMAAYLVAANGNPPEPETTAECAYFMAAAMIAERNK